MRKKLFFGIGLTLLAVLFAGLFISCDLFGADEKIRDTSKVIVAYVYPYGGTILENAKDLRNGNIGLTSKRLTDEKQVTNYLAKNSRTKITTLVFRGFTSIEAKFTDPIFADVTKIIFDGTVIPDVCEKAFESFHKLREVEFIGEGFEATNMGPECFGPYGKEGLIIVVPDKNFIAYNELPLSAPNAGNYYYFIHGNIYDLSSSKLHRIYILDSYKAYEEIGEDEHQYVINYVTTGTNQKVKIHTLPDVGGRIAEWGAEPCDVSLSGGFSVGNSNFSDNNTTGTDWTITIPAGLDMDFVAWPSYVIPASNRDTTIITVHYNWPSYATTTNVLVPPSNGEMQIVYGASSAFCLKGPTVPLDIFNDNVPFGYWVGVADKRELDRGSGFKVTDCILREEDGRWVVTKNETPYSTNGKWISTATSLDFYAYWVNPESEKGVRFFRNLHAGDKFYWWEWQRDADRRMKTPSDFEAFLENGGEQGYKFEGFYRTCTWSGSEATYTGFCDSDWFEKSNLFETTTTDVYAKWTPKDVVISFAHCVDNNKTAGKFETTLNDKTLKYNHPLTSDDLYLSQMTRNGYRFDGWFTSTTDGNLITDTDCTVFDIDTIDFSNPDNLKVTLYAHWTPYKTIVKLVGHQEQYSSYTDEYEKDGYVEFYFDDKVYSSATEVGRATGFIIEGYYKENSTDSDKVLDFKMQPCAAVDSFTTITNNGVLVWYGNITDADNTKDLHTIWRKDEEYQVKFHKNWTTYSDTDELVDSQLIIRGKYATDVTTATDGEDWLKTGYRFKGWYTTNTTFTGYETTVGTYGVDGKFNFNETTITDHLDLYALWEPKEYHVHLDAYPMWIIGATVTPMSEKVMQFVKYDEVITFDFIPALEGYSFGGWSYTRGTKNVQGIPRYLAHTTTTNLTETDLGTVELYAVWTKDTGGVVLADIEVKLDLGSRSEDGVTELFAYRNGIEMPAASVMMTSGKYLDNEEPHNVAALNVIRANDLILKDSFGNEHKVGYHIVGFATGNGTKIIDVTADGFKFTEWDFALEEKITDAYNYVNRLMVYDDVSKTYQEEYQWKGGGATLFALWERD